MYLSEARFRLYRSRLLQVNSIPVLICIVFDIHEFYTLSHLSELTNLPVVKFRTDISALFLQKFAIFYF